MGQVKTSTGVGCDERRKSDRSESQFVATMHIRKLSWRWPLFHGFSGSTMLLLVGATIILLTAKPKQLPAAAQSNASSRMVLIPSGDFIMGTDDPNSMPNERPSHKVQVG